MVLHPLISGGGLFRNNRALSKDQVLKGFFKYIKKNFNARVDKVDDEIATDIPTPFQPFLAGVRAQINRLKERTGNNENVLKAAIETSEDCASNLLKSLTKPGDKTRGEEKVAMIAEVLWKEVDRSPMAFPTRTPRSRRWRFCWRSSASATADLQKRSA